MNPNEVTRRFCARLKPGMWHISRLHSELAYHGPYVSARTGKEVKEPERQAMNELERISDGPVTRVSPKGKVRGGRIRVGDESILFAFRGFKFCPQHIWERHGGEGEPTRGWYIKLPPGSADAHWDMDAADIKRNSAGAFATNKIDDYLDELARDGKVKVFDIATARGIKGKERPDAMAKTRQFIRGSEKYYSFDQNLTYVDITTLSDAEKLRKGNEEVDRMRAMIQKSKVLLRKLGNPQLIDDLVSEALKHD